MSKFNWKDAIVASVKSVALAELKKRPELLLFPELEEHLNKTQIEEQKEPTKKVEDKGPVTDECCVCYVKQKNTVLVPCGHLGLCFDCANSLLNSGGKCPFCRNSFKVQKIFKM